MNNNEQTERERFLHCPACAERLSLVTQILDPRRGKTVRLFKCNKCGERIWEE